MRRWIATLVTLLVLAPSLAGAQPLPGQDNFAPPTDDDVLALTALAAKVPACELGRCSEFSCPAMAGLDAALVDASNDALILDAQLRIAARALGELLDKFIKDYERLTADDEDVRIVLAIGKASLSVGKIILDATSIYNNVVSIRDIATGVSANPGMLESFGTVLLLLDRTIETGSNVVSIIDEIKGIIGQKPILAPDLAALQAKKSGFSDILSSIVAMRDTLRELREAHRLGDAARIADAELSLTRLQRARGSIAQLVGKFLVAIAELRMQQLADRLAENATLEDAANAAFAENYKLQARLLDRVVRLSLAARALAEARGRLGTCPRSCPEWPQNARVPDVVGKSYGDILRVYNPLLLADTARIEAELGQLAFKPGRAISLAVVPGVSPPASAARVDYDVPQCKATEGAKLRIVDANRLLMPLAVVVPGAPRTQPFLSPEDVGRYEIRITDSTERETFASATFRVEIPTVPEAKDYCGVTLTKGIYSSNWKDKAEYMAPKKMPFAFGEPDDADYLKGTLTITPGINCGSGRLAFPVYGGLETQYFQVHMDAGDINRVTNLSLWFSQLRVKFDTGATQTSYDTILGVNIPTGAKKVLWVEMQFVRGGNDRTFSWTAQ